MPELPEVEAFKFYFTTNCLRKQIEDIKTLDGSIIKKISTVQFKKSLVDHQFTSAERIGKYLVININDSDKKLVMHFGLTGSLYYTKQKDEIIKFSRVDFIFKHGILHWICKRKFGKLWLLDDIKIIPGLKKMGPDALAISQKEFLNLLSKKESKNIKAFLMDQAIIAGIGNEYSDEVLFQAGIDPHHRVSDLSIKTRQKLYVTMQKVLNYAVKIQIKNIKNTPPIFYRKTFGSSFLQAHRHVDKLCPKNKKHMLKKATIAGRTSYYCPIDQK